MSDTIQSNVEFVLTGTLTIGGTSVSISDDTVNGGACDFTDASILLTNARRTVIERVKGTASAGILTLSKRGITEAQALTEDSALEKEWRPGTKAFVTIFAYDHFDIEGDLNLNGNITPSNVAKPGFRPQSLTQTQINALPTTGQAIVWNSTTGLYNVLQAGAWVPLDTGTVTPNASTTVAGKVETATDAQITASTDTGETGALLHVLPSQANKIVSLAGTETAIAEDDLIVFSDTDASGVNKKITKANARETMAASTTAKGTVEMATDAEALAGTDETRYINPKQAKDNYSNKYLSSASVSASVAVPATANVAVIAATCSDGARTQASDIVVTRT